jgi:hypothetical protein
MKFDVRLGPHSSAPSWYFRVALNPLFVGGFRVYFTAFPTVVGCRLIFWPYLCLRALLLGF